MKKKLEILDIEILECLDRYGPRNISHIAHETGVTWDTVNYRLDRLSTFFSLNCVIGVKSSSVGLRNAFLVIKSVPSSIELLLNCLKMNDFWRYIGQSYGGLNNVIGIYSIPIEYSKSFSEFFTFLKSLDFVNEIKLYWITGFYTVNPSLNWFDSDLGRWVLRWDDWVEEIPQIEGKPHPALVTPKDFPLQADDVDIKILSRLEINGKENLREIAQRLNLTSPDISYHFKEHILKKGLIGQWNIILKRFQDNCDYYFFIFKFFHEEDMMKFARSLLDKPFSLSVARVFNEKTLIAHLIIPSIEFSKFLHSLDVLMRCSLLQYYDYIMEDFSKSLGHTIAYNCFKSKEWIYDHQKHLKKLIELISESQRTTEPQFNKIQ